LGALFLLSRKPCHHARVTEGGTPRVEYACERCGSVAVTRDAWAEWNLENQTWMLSEIFDFAFCHTCHRESRLTERARR
jgi:hypothetical protein